MPPFVAARPDAIVVLGCRVSEALDAELHRRAEVAARAFHELEPRVVVASGGRLWNGVAEASALRSYLIALGVPPNAVVRELWSLTTIENALYSGELLRAASLEHALVVTSDWHLDRALSCFAACRVRATGRAAPSPSLSFFASRKRRFAERVRTRIGLSSLPLWFGT
jgi:uncharacterized SAM-binding protein YcdF (DUF218 family)